MQQLSLKIAAFYLVALVAFVSCYDTKSLDFGSFEIEVPKTWQPVKAKGIDSHVGRIAIDKQDALFFDLGWYSNELRDEDYLFENYAGEIIQPDGSLRVPEHLKRNSDVFTKIDGRNAKLVEPKKLGYGITGVYFDSLWTGGSNNVRFQLSGHDLQPENQKAVLQAIKTLKFFRKEKD